MKAPPPRHPASVCLLPSEFPPSPCLRPQALAPVQSLTLASRSGRTSEMAVAARVEGDGASAACRSDSPGAPCRAFHDALFHKIPRCLFSNGVVFLELKSNSALRGTSLWTWPQLEPGPDWRRVGAVPWASSPPRSAPLGPFCWMQDDP